MDSHVLQGVEPWISQNDIDKDAIWFDQIHSTLKGVSTGILCVTRDNMNAPWLLFEAGALSKGLSKNRVIPFLVDLTPTDLTAPLSQLNGVRPTRDDFFKMLQTINKQQDENSLTEDRLRRVYDKWWQDFESDFQRIMSTTGLQQVVIRRKPDSILEEILETTRSIQQHLRDIPTGEKILEYVDEGLGRMVAGGNARNSVEKSGT